MRKLLIERGPAVGVWLFSMAAQLSGYNNAAIALFLLGLAMFFLVAPAGYHLQARRKEQGLPILSTIQTVTLVGIGGTWLFLTVTLASVGWSI